MSGFLGFVINTQNMTIALPSQKIHSIQKEATLVVSRCSPVEDLSTFHWHPGGYKASGTYRAFILSCFTNFQDKDTHQSSSCQVIGKVTKEVQVDLWWCATQLPNCCSSSIVKQEATIVIESDASNSG